MRVPSGTVPRGHGHQGVGCSQGSARPRPAQPAPRLPDRQRSPSKSQRPGRWPHGDPLSGAPPRSLPQPSHCPQAGRGTSWRSADACGHPQDAKRVPPRCGGALTWPRQTGHAPKPAGHWAGHPGQAPPGQEQAVRPRGRGSNAGGVLPWGSHLTPLSACFLICNLGEILSAPEGRCEGQTEDDTHQRPARGLSGPHGERRLRAQTRPGQSPPRECQPCWGDGWR